MEHHGGGRLTPAFDPSHLPDPLVTRYAPSPTGYLHLGHVANAIYTWGLARQFGGTVLLRIEDHDRGRSRALYEAAILEDLEWLGFEPDRGDYTEFRAGATPFRQSDNQSAYRDALDRLAEDGLVYGCDCSRKQIHEAAPAGPGRESRYPGTCRDRGLGISGAVRVALGPGTESFADLRAGPVRQNPDEQCGDLLARDRHGNWTYQFAVAVDDWRQGVTLIVRGEDLFESSGRQIRLARLLRRAANPVFLHHPLIRDDTGNKLSKRDGATGVRELRASGLGPEAVIGRAAFGVGLVDEPRPIAAPAVYRLFRRSREERT